MNYSQYSDSELVNLYKAKQDGEAFSVLYKRYATLVFGLSYKYLKDQESAKDMVSEIFIKLMQKLPQTQPEHFDRWLYVVSKNTILNHLRKVNVKFEDLDHNIDVHIMENEQEMSLHSKDIQEKQLETAINNLNEEQNVCIKLFYLQKKSYQEVALHTGYDIKKVKSCIQNGKRNLKLFLNQLNDEP